MPVIWDAIALIMTSLYYLFANHLRAISQEVLIDLIRGTCSDWIVKITTTYPWGQWVSNTICLLKNDKSYTIVFLFVVFDMIIAIIIGHYIKWLKGFCHLKSLMHTSTKPTAERIIALQTWIAATVA